MKGKEICSMILSTVSNIGKARSIGIDVMDKYENVEGELIQELIEDV